jgi:hypothetical protein
MVEDEQVQAGLAEGTIFSGAVRAVVVAEGLRPRTVGGHLGKGGSGDSQNEETGEETG